jgi:hypothetical protein
LNWVLQNPNQYKLLLESLAGDKSKNCYLVLFYQYIDAAMNHKEEPWLKRVLDEVKKLNK